MITGGRGDGTMVRDGSGGPIRRARRRRRTVRGRRRGLAGPKPGAGSWSWTEAVPPREDLRRRPHPPGGAPARGHGPGRATSPPIQRFEGLRSIAHGVTLELRLARAPRLPVLRLRGAPPRPRRHGRRPGGQGRRHPSVRHRGASSRSSTAVSSPARSSRVTATAVTRPSGPGTSIVADGANSRFGRALGTARDRRYPLGMADARLLPEPLPRRALDREPPRPPRPRREPSARLRVDLPGRGRHRQRRGRAALHVHRMEGRQHQPSDGGVLRHRPRPVGDRPRHRVPARPPAASSRPGWVGLPEGRPHLVHGRRRRRAR